jgi:hypothetical protein
MAAGATCSSPRPGPGHGEMAGTSKEGEQPGWLARASFCDQAGPSLRQHAQGRPDDRGRQGPRGPSAALLPLFFARVNFSDPAGPALLKSPIGAGQTPVLPGQVGRESEAELTGQRPGRAGNGPDSRRVPTCCPRW